MRKNIDRMALSPNGALLVTIDKGKLRVDLLFDAGTRLTLNLFSRWQSAVDQFAPSSCASPYELQNQSQSHSIQSWRQVLCHYKRQDCQHLESTRPHSRIRTFCSLLYSTRPPRRRDQHQLESWFQILHHQFKGHDMQNFHSGQIHWLCTSFSFRPPWLHCQCLVFCRHEERKLETGLDSRIALLTHTRLH